MVRSKKPSLEPIVEYKARELIEEVKESNQPVSETFSQIAKKAAMDQDYTTLGTVVEAAKICQVRVHFNIESEEKGK